MIQFYQFVKTKFIQFSRPTRVSVKKIIVPVLYIVKIVIVPAQSKAHVKIIFVLVLYSSARKTIIDPVP